MNIFFDVDFTLVGLDLTLRPGTHDTMQKLLADGHKIYIWSGVGIRWPEVREHNLTPYVTDCYVKPLDHFEEKLSQMNLPAPPDLVIDDYPEVPTALGGFWVRPYFFYSSNDNELEVLYGLITEVAQTGRSDNRRYKPRPAKGLFQ
ncbi:MAG: hypothetical protein HY681_12615 [Chloroflexi bacterium]|nr:hypothetical protein [Chloroflexota bacterium]